jgi:DNA/RNA endonuclease YhcR with UshA esterase domain
MRSISLRILLALLLFFSLKTRICAQEEIPYTSLFITEIMPNPVGSDTDHEWVELYNSSDTSIELSNCSLDGAPFPGDILIQGRSYLIAAKDLLDKDKDNESFEKRYGNGSNVWGDDLSENYSALELSINLSNTHDVLTLQCLNYTNSVEWSNAEEGKSFSLNLDGEWVKTSEATPGHENIFPDEVPGTLQISEVFPLPREGENEAGWIELYNYGESEITLAAFQLESDGISFICPSEIIKSQGYFIIMAETLPFSFPSEGGKIMLMDTLMMPVDEFEYDTVHPSNSFIREWNGESYNEEIFETSKPTMGEQNVLVEPMVEDTSEVIMAIRDVKNEKISSNVVTSGIITSQPNLLGNNIFYIQDDTAGIQIYSSVDSVLSGLHEKDKIEVSGILREINGEKRILVNETGKIKIISSGNVVHGISKKTKDVGALTEGLLVSLQGKIVETSGNTFYIDDGSGKAKIIVKSSTKITLPKKQKGDEVKITGIVSQYGDAYRVLPRIQSDVLIGTGESQGKLLAQTGYLLKSGKILGIFLMILSRSFFYLDRKRKLF